MANENNPAGAVNELVDVVAKAAKQQAEVLNNAINSAVSLIEPLGKACVSFLSSVMGTAAQVYQSIADAMAPKQ
ncbi:MAG: chlorosome envelope protein B [Chlorobiaceae bacterium]|nr:chlorosome envelope protein B [Chlorobiaceae bacterium]